MYGKISIKLCLVLILFCPQIRAQNKGKLPIVVLAAKSDDSLPMVLLITGDGGWKGFTPMLSAQFVKEGIPVVALNALHYFWKKKTPDQTAATAVELLNNFSKKWHKTKFILVGYSFGADVMPFIFNRLPVTLSKKCMGMALFSPGKYSDFEVHISQMMGRHKKWKYNVVDAIKAMKPVKIQYFFGKKEDTWFPKDIIDRPDWQVHYLPGGHHYDIKNLNLGKWVYDKLKS